MRTSKGFTLIELMIVVAIIGIIAAIAVPTLISTRKAALKSYGEGICSTVRSAQAAFYAQNGEYGSLAELVAGNFLDDRFLTLTDFDGRNNFDITETGDGLQTFSFTLAMDAAVNGTVSVDESGEITFTAP